MDILAILWSITTGLGVNLATPGIQRGLKKVFNPDTPALRILWERFYLAFFDAINLIEKNEGNRFGTKKAKAAQVLRQELQRYIGESNHFALVKIFQEHSRNNFEGFIQAPVVNELSYGTKKD